MDQSQLELSRKLSGNPDDPRRFTVDDLERFVSATGDMTPILYLVEKYMADSETKRITANAQLAKMLPEVMALIKAVQA